MKRTLGKGKQMSKEVKTLRMPPAFSPPQFDQQQVGTNIGKQLCGRGKTAHCVRHPSSIWTKKKGKQMSEEVKRLTPLATPVRFGPKKKGKQMSEEVKTLRMPPAFSPPQFDQQQVGTNIGKQLCGRGKTPHCVRHPSSIWTKKKGKQMFTFLPQILP